MCSGLQWLKIPIPEWNFPILIAVNFYPEEGLVRTTTPFFIIKSEEARIWTQLDALDSGTPLAEAAYPATEIFLFRSQLHFVAYLKEVLLFHLGFLPSD